jgi:UPF0716 protein FxsA
MRTALIVFITVPLIEMVVLIQVGGLIGAIPTVALVVLTATLGIWLLKLEGLATLARVQQKLDQGQIPETELLEGIMLLVGGALLLTPGFITDAMGFTCLLPGLRRPLARWIIRRGVLRAMNLSGSSFTSGTFSNGTFSSGSSTTRSTPPGQQSGLDDKMIEGEFREEDQ